MSRKVFIFGAGASKAVNAPLQSELLYDIFDLAIEKPINPKTTDFISLSYQISSDLSASYEVFLEDRKKLARFIANTFGSKSILEDLKKVNNKIETDWKNIFNKIKNISVSLEDLFTILDKISFNHDHFRYYKVEYINEIRLALNRCIIYALSYRIETKGSNLEIYETLSDILVQERITTEQKDDPFSIITLNWDNILDKYIYKACQKYNNSLTEDSKCAKIMPDYCFYNYYLQEKDSNEYMPSFHVKAKGHYNIKILKLHGSVNWLFCPKCGRMYIDYNKNIALETMVYSSRSDDTQLHCRYCSKLYYKDYIEEIEGTCSNPTLQHLLITPTFLKEFSNIHLKNIWHNAQIDLSEANEVIFIGYSFPDADFEIRYLLKQSIPPSAKIKVVLAPTDNPEYYAEMLKSVGNRYDQEWLLSKLNLPHYRFKNFFGTDTIEFYYDGLENFFK